MRERLEQELFGQQDNETKSWQRKGIWQRGLAMLLFGFIAGFIRFIITLIAIFQFFSLLVTSKANPHLQKLGQSLNHYIYQINQFLTANTERYPFPFSAWPDGNVSRLPTDNE